MTEYVELAPEYRYYAVDLLGNYTLAEIPFRGVSWGRALKGAGSFSGKIPVIEATESLSLYDSTMPGKTAIFVVRNGVCVWGGIIWSREYDAASKDLSVSASEFTSYFHHRRIWKTWNHQFGATLVVSGGAGHVTFDYGSTTPVFPGSSVQFQFYAPSDFRYDGYYRVAGTPAPTLSGFDVVGGHSVADISSVEIIDNIAYITTVSSHSFGTGDLITVSSSYGAPFNGTFEITLPSGANSNMFTYPLVNTNVARISDSGTSVRPTPDGTYTSVTVTVRSDTYDYVRNLIDAVFSDFVGTQFPNVYIEPGIDYSLNVTDKELSGGYASITTDTDHNLAVGQAVVIQDVGPEFDGEFEVTQTPNTNVLLYVAGGAMVSTSVGPTLKTIEVLSLAGQVATVTTGTAHGFLVGNHVSVFAGYDYSELSGDQTITAVLSATKFQFSVYSTNYIPEKILVDATVTDGVDDFAVVASSISGNVATLTTDAEHTYAVSDSVIVANVNRSISIVEKSLDAPNSVASIKTAIPHGFQVGQSVIVDGLRDTSGVVLRRTTGTSATFTVDQFHNFKVGDSLVINNMVDSYPISTKALASNVVTLTTEYPHNIPVGDILHPLQVSGLVDEYVITNKELLDNVVTLTTSVPHNVLVNSTVLVKGLSDSSTVVSLAAQDGIGILTLASPHNFLESQEITVSGVGAPFDGTMTLLSVSDTRILFEIDNEGALILPAQSSGNVSSPDSYLNGEYTVSAVSSSSISYLRTGNDVGTQTDSGSITTDSIMNGTSTVTAVTSTTVQYSLVANNSASTPVVPPADGEEALPALAEIVSIFDGTYTVSSITRNTFTVPKTGLISDSVDRPTSGQASVMSIFNGTHTITAVSTYIFKFALTASSNQLENSPTLLATATATNIFNGTYTITAVDSASRTFSYAKTWPDLPSTYVQGFGTATVFPVAIVGTYGPYPGNANIGMKFSTKKYSGINVQPILYRGFELQSVGEALDAYSDSIDGFEYRIDCSYDADLDTFIKTFVLLPIDFPDPPTEGEVAPTSRYGADKLVFEYPGGNISSLGISESAEDSATRFFAVGETDLGPDVGPNISIASAQDLLSGSNGESSFRKWPLLDDSEKVDNVDDETVLYAYASRYLSENRPPGVELSVSVNGSIPPVVGTYVPGDWCSLIIDDAFIKMRLASDLEPRDDVLVRKIDQFQVTVPDSVTFPETVSLTLVPEWEVDKRGKSSV